MCSLQVAGDPALAGQSVSAPARGPERAGGEEQPTTARPSGDRGGGRRGRGSRGGRWGRGSRGRSRGSREGGHPLQDPAMPTSHQEGDAGRDGRQHDAAEEGGAGGSPRKLVSRHFLDRA